ncbi:hypothetical protein BRD17_06185 [Halobacteriales archaeon SW_7_68_16]|nr:MAG: hypothetical protein BRD17_06185 [Halobacteriales archaeon SW_7_68_16]
MIVTTGTDPVTFPTVTTALAIVLGHAPVYPALGRVTVRPTAPGGRSVERPDTHPTGDGTVACPDCGTEPATGPVGTVSTSPGAGLPGHVASARSVARSGESGPAERRRYTPASGTSGRCT